MHVCLNSFFCLIPVHRSDQMTFICIEPFLELQAASNIALSKLFSFCLLVHNFFDCLFSLSANFSESCSRRRSYDGPGHITLSNWVVHMFAKLSIPDHPRWLDTDRFDSLFLNSLDAVEVRIVLGTLKTLMMSFTSSINIFSWLKVMSFKLLFVGEPLLLTSITFTVEGMLIVDESSLFNIVDETSKWIDVFLLLSKIPA